MAKKVKVVVTHQETVTFDAGDIPDGLVKAMVEELVDGNIGTWSLGDIGGDWEVIEHDVVIG